MKFQINEKKVTLPENVHAYAEKKVSKLDRYFRDERRLPLRCKDPLGSAGADQPSAEHHLILRGAS